jgi:hypothetical protein
MAVHRLIRCCFVLTLFCLLLPRGTLAHRLAGGDLLPPICMDEAFIREYISLPGSYEITLINSINLETPTSLKVFRTALDGYDEKYLQQGLKVFGGTESKKQITSRGLIRYAGDEGWILFSLEDGGINWYSPSRYKEITGQATLNLPKQWQKRVPDDKLIAAAITWVKSKEFSIVDYEATVDRETTIEVNILSKSKEVFYQRYTVSFIPTIEGYRVLGNTARLEVGVSPNLEVIEAFYRWIPWDKDGKEYPTHSLHESVDLLNSGIVRLPPEFRGGTAEFLGVRYYASDKPQAYLQPVYEFSLRKGDKSFNVFMPALKQGNYKNSIPLIDCATSPNR